MSSPQTPHAVLVPYPAQGHVTPLLNLAKLLHSVGFHITFVNTDYNHHRLLRAQNHVVFSAHNTFRFEAIPDGLPQSEDDDATQDIAELCISTTKNCVAPLRELLVRLNGGQGPKVSCVIADGVMSFAQRVAEEMGIPGLAFWTTSACGFMGYLHFEELIRRGYTPLKDESYLTNGYLETEIDWIPGMPGIRLKDIPSFIRTTNPNDIMLHFDGGEAQNAFKAQGVIHNTFDELEHEVLHAMKQLFPCLYTIGPLQKLVNQLDDQSTNLIGSNLWKEDSDCLRWLDSQEAASVVYVNFGSITVMTAEQLREFANGLANSNHPYLWVIRSDLVAGKKEGVDVLPKDLKRGILSSWCPQEKVLSHPSVGVFLTHSGWNSTLESICGGVPMICWPFFSEQTTNCRYVCTKWWMGVELDGNVGRDEVEGVVRELMEGGKGMEMRMRARKWKEKAEGAIKQGGSSYTDLEKLVQDLKTVFVGN